MESPQILKREIKALAFDQYGTVVDMQKGLTDAVTPFLHRKGWQGSPNSFVTWWRRTHFENSMIDALLDRGHTPYRQIGHRAVSYVMDRCGIAYTQDEVRALLGEIENLQVSLKGPANFVTMALGKQVIWLVYAPLPPLFLLMFSGLYMFALPYFAKTRSV